MLRRMEGRSKFDVNREWYEKMLEDSLTEMGGNFLR